MIKLHNVLDFAAYRILCVSRYVENGIKLQSEWDRYWKENPYELIRFDYPLDENSLVIDLGAHMGEHFATRIYSRYSCNIKAYEPHPTTFAALQESFKYTPKIKTHGYALSDRDGLLQLHGSNLVSSLTESIDGEINAVKVVKASKEFKNISHINLLKINIEGAEFNILPDLYENYGLEKIDHIQVQFHNFVPDFKQKKKLVVEALEQTHTKKWGYENVYESWSLK